MEVRGRCRKPYAYSQTGLRFLFKTTFLAESGSGPPSSPPLHAPERFTIRSKPYPAGFGGQRHIEPRSRQAGQYFLVREPVAVALRHADNRIRPAKALLRFARRDIRCCNTRCARIRASRSQRTVKKGRCGTGSGAVVPDFQDIALQQLPVLLRHAEFGLKRGIPGKEKRNLAVAHEQHNGMRIRSGMSSNGYNT